MKIKNSEIQSTNIGEFEEIQSTINNKDLGLALTMVSKNLYSNPIGSFIREIVSNGVDANTKAGVNNPVKVHIYKENEISFIEITDNGTGISPDNFKNIYMSWFNSDKRDNNKEIGGWGLGSKSPLSYQDSFEISTVYEGIKYDYILVNELPVVNATLLSKSETTEKNGTSIKIEIKKGDEWKISEECRSQLMYFDDVYVLNEIYYYNNNFNIIETEHFKIRPDITKDMHLCLGQVTYPINWEVINTQRINISIALKFEIGELDVTLSREEINYTEETKETINNKIKTVIEYLKEIFNKQTSELDFFKYLKRVKGDDNLYINVGEYKLNINYLKHSINNYFKPLEVNIKEGNIGKIFTLYDFFKIENGIKKDSEVYKGYIISNINNFYLVNDKISHYTNLCISNGYIVKRKKITRKNILDICKVLNIELINGINNWNSYLPLGISKKINTFIKYLDNYIQENTNSYEAQYDEEFVENYKRELKEAQEERKEIITHYNLYNKRLEVKFSELLDNYTYILYISKKEEKEKIVHYYSLYQSLKEDMQKHIYFFIINPTVIKKLKNKKGFYPVEKIFNIRILKPHFRRIKISYLKRKIGNKYKLLAYSTYYKKLYDKLYIHNVRFEYTYEDVPYRNYTVGYDVNLYETFKDKIDNIKLPKNKELIYEYYLDILEEYVNKMDIFMYIQDMPHKHIVSIVSHLKILKLNPKYYKK